MAAEVRGVSAKILQQVALAMLPFYRKIASNQKYAQQWSKAVVSADLDLMGKMLRGVSREAGRQGLGSNAIGYFISFSEEHYPWTYMNGTTIPPGSVQFHFSTRVHRAIARALIPLYRKLACSRSFAMKLAGAIRQNDSLIVERLVRKLVGAHALKSVEIEDGGIVLTFKYSYSKYSYENLLLRELSESK